MKITLKKLETIPNEITISRLLFGLLTFFFLIKAYYIAALIFYILGATTDALDGYIARKLKKTSKLGGLLDAVVDRIFIILVVLGLLIAGKFTPIILGIIILWIIGELIMGGLISRKIKKIYLSVTHRNSIRLAAVFFYIFLGALIIIEIDYIIYILIILVAITGIYALIDHIIYFKKIKT